MIFSGIYNGVLFLFAALYRLGKGKKGFRPFGIGKSLDTVSERKKEEMRIWIHASSLGETKAIKPLISLIGKDLPHAKIFFSTSTSTGYKEAVSYEGKMLYLSFRLPLDFSWSMKKVVKKISPDLFILVESDFWYHLHKALKEHQVPIALVNGRVSDRSYRFFKKIPFWSTLVFSSIDLCCLQEEEYVKRFKDLKMDANNIHVTGNVKYDMQKKTTFDDSLQFPTNKQLITIASTHPQEEEMILAALREMDSSFCFLLAPRHPERFSAVKEYLEKETIPFRTISQNPSKEDRIILVDKMGILDHCFKVSKAAIVGGSFIKEVGGHNIYEPARFGIPVFYGPYMYKQAGLVKALKKHKIGSQVNLDQLKSTLEYFLSRQEELSSYANLQLEMEGATNRSWQHIRSLKNLLQYIQ